MLAVVFNPKPPSASSSMMAEGGGLDMRPWTADLASNSVCVWVDPFWTGIVCKRMGEPIITTTTNTNNKNNDEGGGTATTTSVSSCTVVFHVQGMCVHN